MPSRSEISLAGIFPPIPTPFQHDESLALEALRLNLCRWNQEPLFGYVVGGSNGEFVYLTPDERIKIVETAREEIPYGRLLIAGAAAESTGETIRITARMAEAGADAAIVVTPSYFKGQMTASVLEAHFGDVADASPIPVVLYSVPANTNIDLPASAIVPLAHHPNIIGLKDSGGDVAKLGTIIRDAPPGFQVLAGSASFLLGALAVGAVGAVSALANIAAGRLAELMEAYRRGDAEAARSLQLSLIEANRGVTSRFGVAGLKAAMDMLGYAGGPVRRPLRPLGEEDRQALRAVLIEAGLL